MKIIAEFGRPRVKRYHVEWWSVHGRTWYNRGHYRYRATAWIVAAFDALFGDQTRVVDTGVVA